MQPLGVNKLFLHAAVAVAMALPLAGAALAQQQSTPAASGQTASAATPARKALSATETAAVAQMLSSVNGTSGEALQAEVRRLATQYSDQGFNVPEIARAVKAGAGNKLGAVNTALSAACRAAAVGSAASMALCDAASVVADGGTDPFARNEVAAIQTAATGGGGGGGGGGLGALTGSGGTGTGNGTGSGGGSGSTAGLQSGGASFSPGSRSGVGTSVATGGTTTSSVSPF